MELLQLLPKIQRDYHKHACERTQEASKPHQHSWVCKIRIIRLSERIISVGFWDRSYIDIWPYQPVQPQRIMNLFLRCPLQIIPYKKLLEIQSSQTIQYDPWLQKKKSLWGSMRTEDIVLQMSRCPLMLEHASGWTYAIKPYLLISISSKSKFLNHGCIIKKESFIE